MKFSHHLLATEERIMQSSELIYQRTLRCSSVFTVILCMMLITPKAHGTAKDGKEIFEEHCVECHGTEGDGRGAVGPYLNGQRPANLLAETTQVRSDQELFEIIRYGIHIEMPSWEGVLTDQEIWNLVKYLRTLALQFP